MCLGRLSKVLFTSNNIQCLHRSRFTDPNKLGPLCVAIQRYYTSIQAKTQVLPASLTSTDEILSLAGVHHITIGPGLLEQLSKLDSSTTTVKSLFDEEPSVPVPDSKISYLNDPATYRIVFTRDLGGASEEKLTQVCLPMPSALKSTGFRFEY